MEADGALRDEGDLKILGDACQEVEVGQQDGDILYKPMLAEGIDKIFDFRQKLYGTTDFDPSTEFVLSYDNILTYFPFNVLSKYAAFSCEFVFELTVTATMETSGLLLLHYMPNKMAPVTTGVTGIDYVSPARAFNTPHAELNIAYRKTAELTVPYPFLLPFEYIRDTDGGRLIPATDMKVALTTIVPIAAAAAAPTFSTTLFVRLKNLKVFASKPKDTYSLTVLQSGEKNREKTAIGYAAGSFAKYTKPSWWLRAMGETAEAFGYSTPQTAIKPERILNTNTGNEMYYDVPRVLDVVHTNSKATTSTCGAAMSSTEDQMSLKWLCGRYSLLGISYGKDDSGSVCMIVPISMPHLWYRGYGEEMYCVDGAYPVLPVVAPAAPASFQPSGLLFFSSMFARWRGSLKFRIQLVRPRYSQGKIAINFNPGYTARGPPYMANSSVFTTTGVDTNGRILEVDLGDDEFIDFTIPFMANTHSACFEDCLGAVTVSWVTGYQGPEGVKCYMLMHVAAGDDFMLMDPVAPRLVPTNRLDYVEMQSGEQFVELQAGDAPGNVHQVVKPLSVAAINDNGEINSIKQLLCMPYWTSQVLNANTYQCYFAPWMFRTVLPTGADSLPKYADSYQSVLASCFLLGKGGTEVHIYTPNDDTIVTFASVPSTYVDSTPFLRYPHVDTPIIGPIFVKGPHHAKHFVVPCQMRHSVMPLYTYCSPGGSYTRNNLPFSTNAFKYGLSERNYPDDAIFPLRIPAAIIQTLATTSTLTWGIAAADDAALSFYMGPPPCYVRSNESPTTYHPSTIFV